MTGKSYSEKLRDPRWQKMRLLILERDNWTCRICFDSTSTLHVHHRYYEFGKEPWEYLESSLVTLCEGCHDRESELRKQYEQELLHQLRLFFFASDLERLAKAFRSYKPLHDEEVMASAIALVLENQEVQQMVLDALFDPKRHKKE